jgi:hypothetical protein
MTKDCKPRYPRFDTFPVKYDFFKNATLLSNLMHHSPCCMFEHAQQLEGNQLWGYRLLPESQPGVFAIR